MSPRPKKPAADRKTETMQIRLTRDQLAAIEKAAAAELLEPSTWARAQVLKAAGYRPPK